MRSASVSSSPARSPSIVLRGGQPRFARFRSSPCSQWRPHRSPAPPRAAARPPVRASALQASPARAAPSSSRWAASFSRASTARRCCSPPPVRGRLDLGRHLPALVISPMRAPLVARLAPPPLFALLRSAACSASYRAERQLGRARGLVFLERGRRAARPPRALPRDTWVLPAPRRGPLSRRARRRALQLCPAFGCFLTRQYAPRSSAPPRASSVREAAFRSRTASASRRASPEPPRGRARRRRGRERAPFALGDLGRAALELRAPPLPARPARGGAAPVRPAHNEPPAPPRPRPGGARAPRWPRAPPPGP